MSLVLWFELILFSSINLLYFLQ